MGVHHWDLPSHGTVDKMVPQKVNVEGPGFPHIPQLINNRKSGIKLIATSAPKLQNFIFSYTVA